MFKEIQSGLAKFFTKEFILVVIICFVLIWGLLSYSGEKYSFKDNMEGGSNEVGAEAAVAVNNGVAAPASAVNSSAAGYSSAQAGYALQPVANPKDLLPADGNIQWTELNPSSIKGGDVMMPDLLQAGYHIGLDTIGQSLRNANMQLRSDPVISKSDVGPWNQSTIEADSGRVPLELGRN
jgi:hypothetical protein